MNRETVIVKTVRVDKLILDMTRYPRSRIVIDHVEQLADAIEAGAKLPPVIVWRGRNRVVDGYHKVKAVEMLTNGRGQVAVIERDYATEADAFLDAVRLNAAQGLALSDADRQRSVDIADELGVDPHFLATALSVTADRLGQIRTVGRPAVASDLSVARRPLAVTPTTTATTTALASLVKGNGRTITHHTVPTVEQPRVRVPAKIVIATDTLLDFLGQADAPYRDPRLLASLGRLKRCLELLPLPADGVAGSGVR